VLSLSSGLLTLGSGRSGCCSRPQTKTELAKEKVNIEYVSIVHLQLQNGAALEEKTDDYGGKTALHSSPAKM
jgi:hypothetical protein